MTGNDWAYDATVEILRPIKLNGSADHWHDLIHGIADALRAERKATLERAAKYHDAEAKKCGRAARRGTQGTWDQQMDARDAIMHERHAHAIRALDE